MQFCVCCLYLNWTKFACKCTVYISVLLYTERNKWLAASVFGGWWGRGVYSLKSTSPQQSERRWDESKQSHRDMACLQERSLNNRLWRSAAVTLAACVDAYGVLCSFLQCTALLSHSDTTYFDQQSNKLCLGFLGGPLMPKSRRFWIWRHFSGDINEHESALDSTALTACSFTPHCHVWCVQLGVRLNVEELS